MEKILELFQNAKYLTSDELSYKKETENMCVTDVPSFQVVTKIGTKMNMMSLQYVQPCDFKSDYHDKKINYKTGLRRFFVTLFANDIVYKHLLETFLANAKLDLYAEDVHHRMFDNFVEKLHPKGIYTISAYRQKLTVLADAFMADAENSYRMEKLEFAFEKFSTNSPTPAAAAPPAITSSYGNSNSYYDKNWNNQGQKNQNWKSSPASVSFDDNLMLTNGTSASQDKESPQKFQAPQAPSRPGPYNSGSNGGFSGGPMNNNGILNNPDQECYSVNDSEIKGGNPNSKLKCLRFNMLNTTRGCNKRNCSYLHAAFANPAEKSDAVSRFNKWATNNDGEKITE